jgi:very-short-patch-repair endonuclease
MDISRPFRGSAAVAAGLVTPNVLRGPRFRRLFPDVYAPATGDLDLALRSVAAAVYVGRHGVLVGYSAAELHGASCADRGAPAEVSVPGGGVRGRDGLRVHRFQPAPSELTRVHGCAATTPLRTAYDLGRRADRTAAVVALDALAHGHFTTRAVRDVAMAHRGDRGLRWLRAALELCDPRAESPMESRIRIALHRYRLPAPKVQHPVGPYRLDLAYPAVRLAIEYDGRDHREPGRAIRDLRREAHLARCGWDVLRLRAASVHDARETAIRVHRELVGRGLANVARALPQPRW